MKAFTDLEQSKKLAEILSLESADMMYHSVENEYGTGTFMTTSKFLTNGLRNDDFYIDDIPCWSLAALLNALPKSLIYTPNQALTGYCCKNIMHDLETYGNNPVDACVEMIIKLHEQKLI